MSKLWMKTNMLLLLLVGAFFLALISGSKFIHPLYIFHPESSEHYILTQLRLPRIFAALIVGGLLSLSGLLMQNLVKNPLADPYILGVSGASACIQLILISTGLMFPDLLILFLSFLFASLSLWFLIKISSRSRFNTNKLLLSGVVLAFAYAAIISLTLTLSPLQSVKPMLFWLMGDLSYVKHLLLGATILFMAVLMAMRYHTELDIMARGEVFAQKCGVNVKALNLVILLLTTLLTTMAVNMAGSIGFIGLVIPHLARLLVGNHHKQLIVFSVLLGASVLLIADTLARSLFSPLQMPVGIFTAMIGVPMFLILQWRRT